MSVNAREEEYERVELFGKPALFTNSRIFWDAAPENLHCYDLCGSDYDPCSPVFLEKKALTNYVGSVITMEPVDIPEEGYVRLRGQLSFLGESLSLADFCGEYEIKYKEPKFCLVAASEQEAALFFSQGEEKDAALGCIGHFRFYFDSSGRLVPSLWEDHQSELKTQVFKDEFDDVINTLRENGALDSLSAAQSFCWDHEPARMTDRFHSGSYAFKLETDSRAYCLRLFPNSGDYSYVYCYDKRQLQQGFQAEKAPVVGRLTYANGDIQEFTDPEAYLAALKEELPYHPTTGMKYETLTDAPAVRKAVDDALYDLYGEENPRELSDYEPEQGLTMGGF